MAMASAQKKGRTSWSSDEEKKLIEVWAGILEQTDGKMITRKKKEALATRRVNQYVNEELGKTKTFTEKEIRNKIDWMLKKGKQFYTIYQKKGETGKGVNAEHEIELDLEAAEVAWPNFRVFYETFRGHPSLGPGSVEDSTTISSPTASKEGNTCESEVEPPSEETCLSSARDSPINLESGEEEDEEDEDDKSDSVTPPPKKKPAKEALTARVTKKEKASAKFLSQFAEIQKSSQKSMMEHESRMQSESMAFQAKLEQDRLRFESEMAQRMQQQSQQFQLAMMQQNQLFQAELFKKLFDKKDKEQDN